MAPKILLFLFVALAAGCERDADRRRAGSEAPANAPEGERRSPGGSPVVLFVGTSLTAGYGLPGDLAYPALIQAKIDSAGLDFRVVNAGVSGETSAGGLRRMDWLLRQPVAVLVLELGANDMLRGQQVDALRSNLQQIIDATRAAHPDARIVIAGLKAAPNLGERYAARFEAVFPELARENDAVLIPFLLEGVAGVPELNQPDGNHPTAEGQSRVADNVWVVLGPLVQELAARESEGAL